MSEIKTKEPLVRIIKRDKSSFGYKVWVKPETVKLQHQEPKNFSRSRICNALLLRQMGILFFFKKIF